ncbi:CotH kinase family protein [Mangrovibacterium marinum]|uniref:CotH protein n=1 Tax=Mangrovibacterium marinum TaxID=1639118 RepID=A0A2T5BYV7_9BACT|nr:CotH kinase family protein [Mangrovibacterium marinum]PTN07442.1 CotH protein [Mangrovibacterium marinum]
MPVGKKFLPAFIYLLIFILASCSDEEVNPDEDEVFDGVYSVAKIEITTENATEVDSKESYVNCSISLDARNSDWDYSGSGRIRGRGNSTWLWYPKKPYRIKLDQSAEILGLAADKDWVLLADYRDPTHLMNTFVFTVGQGLGLPYTNHSRYVELTLNGDYMGLYTLTEQVEQGKNRVAIDEDEGLLLSLDVDDGPGLAPEEEDNFWSEEYGMPVRVKDPDIIDEAHLFAIKAEFALLEEAVKSADYNQVDALLDIPSFIDFLLIQELVYNVELAAPRSMYLHKDKGQKWVMGPLWDFDAGYDFDWSTMYTGHNFFSNYKELVLGTSPSIHAGGYYVPEFFTDLFKNRQFVSEYKARWLEIRDQILSTYWAVTLDYAGGFSDAMSRDFQKWPIDKDHAHEIQRMGDWLSLRISYLDGVISNYPDGN